MRPLLRFTRIVVAPLMVVSMLAVAMPVAAQATPEQPSLTFQSGIPYVANATAEQTLDLYLPQTGGNHPLIVWVHGGGWWAGDKTSLDVFDVEPLVLVFLVMQRYIVQGVRMTGIKG